MFSNPRQCYTLKALGEFLGNSEIHKISFVVGTWIDTAIWALSMRLLLSVGLGFVVLTTPPTLVQAQNVDSLFQQGAAAQSAGNYSRAEEIWQQVLQPQPDNAWAYYNLGLALYEQERFKEAATAYLTALYLGTPHDDVVYSGLGNALTQQRRYEEAEDAYRNALTLNPENSSVYIHLGNALTQQRRYEEAEDAYRNALTLNPDDAWTYYTLGLTLYEQERYEDAIEAYRKSLNIGTPNDAVIYVGLGNILIQLGQNEDAEEA